MTLGEFLAEIRKELEMSRHEAASSAEFSGEHLRNIENGDVRPSPELMCRLFHVYDLDEKAQTRAWVLLARTYMPPEVEKRVAVYRIGVADEVADEVLEWVGDYYDISSDLEEDKIYLAYQIQTVMEKQ